MTKRAQLEREIEALESKIAVIDLIESARDDDGKFILKVGFMGCKKKQDKKPHYRFTRFYIRFKRITRKSYSFNRRFST